MSLSCLIKNLRVLKQINGFFTNLKSNEFNRQSIGLHQAQDENRKCLGVISKIKNQCLILGRRNFNRN